MMPLPASGCIAGSRPRAVQVAAAHRHRAKHAANAKRRPKKRDIRTSLSKAPALAAEPLSQASTATAPLVRPPGTALASLHCADVSPQIPDQVLPPVIIKLDGPCQSQSEPVVGATARMLTLEQRHPTAQQLLDAASSLEGTLFAADSQSLSSGSNSRSSVWASAADGFNSFAALDKALDHLIVSSTLNTATSKASSSSLKPPAAASSSSDTKQKSRKGKPCSGTGVAALAVTNILCETDWDRELAAAAPQQQLLVVKVEGNHQLLRGATDPTFRFQTHHQLPTPLNTYLPHPELDFGSFSNINGLSNGAIDSSNNHFSSANDFFPANFPTPMAPSSALFGGSSSATLQHGSSSSTVEELNSPVHHWYKNLAQSYAATNSAAAGNSSLKFLSLNSDSPRAKALCRRLGVSECLSVLLVDASTGRKVLEVCGTKIEQELPGGLLYYGDLDPEGRQPSELLPVLKSKVDREAIRSQKEVAVVAYHMHAAPPCVSSYSVLYEAAKKHSGNVAFGVMDVDTMPDCSADDLGLERLPTYVVYKAGKQVAKLSRRSERKRLGEVLQQALELDALAPAGV